MTHFLDIDPGGSPKGARCNARITSAAFAPVVGVTCHECIRLLLWDALNKGGLEDIDKVVARASQLRIRVAPLLTVPVRVVGGKI